MYGAIFFYLSTGGVCHRNEMLIHPSIHVCCRLFLSVHGVCQETVFFFLLVKSRQKAKIKKLKKNENKSGFMGFSTPLI
jgi:hypothetical protein